MIDQIRIDRDDMGTCYLIRYADGQEVKLKSLDDVVHYLEADECENR